MTRGHGDRDGACRVRLMTFGLIVLLLLSSLALFSAAGVAVRVKPAGRAELFILTSLVWNALVVLPVYVLGYLNVLTATSLAASAIVLFAIAFVGSGFRRDLRM